MQCGHYFFMMSRKISHNLNYVNLESEYFQITMRVMRGHCRLNRKAHLVKHSKHCMYIVQIVCVPWSVSLPISTIKRLWAHNYFSQSTALNLLLQKELVTHADSSCI